MMQDDEEGRSRRLQSTQQKTSKSTVKDLKNILISILDVIAFVGGAWYILTRFVFGPISNMLETDLIVADLDDKTVHKEYS